jgi:tetratricopeptide (TPR) repeat protein
MSKLRITLVDTVNNRRLTVNLPDDVLLEQLVPALARKLGLPEEEYMLTVEETGATLAAGVTLAGVGVAEGEKLLIHTKVVQERPASLDSAQDHIDRGYSQLELGHNRQALANFNRAIEIAPANLDAIGGRARAYQELGQYEQAIADLNRFLEIGSDEVAYWQRGTIYVALGQYQQAIADFSQAIEIKPDDAFFCVQRGGAYLELGQYQQAIADFNRAIQIEPDNTEAYLGRGMAYFELGQDMQARADLEHAFELDPSLKPVGWE